MTRQRKSEIFLILALIAGLSLPSQSPSPQPAPTSFHTPQPETVTSQAILRWSTRGGCYAEGDFYFELRTDETGASWIALFCANRGWWHELQGKVHQAGNYVVGGRLSVEDTNHIVEALEATDPLTVRSQQYHTGPINSLYVKLGDQENKVANFQAEWTNKESPEYKFIRFAYSGLFQRVHSSLKERNRTEEQPDYQLREPGLFWLTDEKKSLFHLYPKIIQRTE